MMSLSTERGYGQTYYQDMDEDEPSARYIQIQNEHDKSQLLPMTQKKSLTDEDRSQLKHHNDFSGHFNARGPIHIKTHKSLLPEIMNRKIKAVKSQIVVYFFNTNRRIVFTRSEIKQHFGQDNKMDPKVKNFIPFIVKQYCKLFLYFEPLEVNYEYFQLKIANLKNKEDLLLDSFSNDEDIRWLFECGSLVLNRKKKNTQRILAWQDKYSDDKEVLEIIIPFQRELLEKIQKNKTINSLKEKIQSYSQLSNIVIVTYHDLKVCEGKKKIGQIIQTDRILEVYREKVNKFEDIPEQPVSKTKKQEYSRNYCNLINQQFEVSSSFYMGQQYLQIIGTKIIEKYEGGLVGYILGQERKIERSIYTLVGLGCDERSIKLEFMRKDGCEICKYSFSNMGQKQQFLKKILRMGRELNQNFYKIEN